MKTWTSKWTHANTEMMRLVQLVSLSAVITGCHTQVPEKLVKVQTARNSLGMEFVALPGGKFNMGSDKSAMSRPVHRVQLDGFEIMATEVTNSHYELFEKRKRAPESLLDDGPVCGVSRKDVLRFVSWLNSKDKYTYSLPTEAQWEYAARGGLDGKDYPWGNNIDDKLALTEGSLAVPVKTFAPNNFGIYEICGNVREMCWGEAYDYSSKDSVNPRGELALDYYATRGSGIGMPLAPWIWDRGIEVEKVKIPGLGFRLVRTMKR